MIFRRISPCGPTNKNFGSGFFSNYRITLEHLIINHEKNFNEIPYIDWGNTAWVEGYNPYEQNIIKNENPFDYWFEQKIPKNNDIIYENNINDRFSVIKHNEDYFNIPDMLYKQRYVDSFYLKPKKHITDKVEKIYNEEIKNEIVLGVIARGCEFSYWHPQYGSYTIEDYIFNIKKILNENKQITKLFIVSEDSNYIDILSKEFSNSFFIPDVFRRTDETLEYMIKYPLWPNISTKRKNQNKLLGEEVIIQTKLLGKCNYLFGMHTGVFAGAVLWGENIQKIYKL